MMMMTDDCLRLLAKPKLYRIAIGSFPDPAI